MHDAALVQEGNCLEQLPCDHLGQERRESTVKLAQILGQCPLNMLLGGQNGLHPCQSITLLPLTLALQVCLVDADKMACLRRMWPVLAHHDNVDASTLAAESLMQLHHVLVLGSLQEAYFPQC